jgi:aminocarboxymuconate-semialdehyde decarboxylase
VNEFAASADDVVDAHAHFMPPDLPDLASLNADHRWPLLIPDADGSSGRVMRGDSLFRVVRPACWDVGARIAELDQVGIGHQVISPIPVILTYWADPDRALEYCRHINDWLAHAVRQSGGRLSGLGTVPLQDTSRAISEMTRAVRELGLSGLEIGTEVNGMELDHDELRPFFRAADRLDVPLFVHATDGNCATRVAGEQVAFGLGMLTDIALAAAAFVFGGVLRECPNLRVCLSHGGGSFAWCFSRLNLFGKISGAAPSSPTPEELCRRLFVDSLVFDSDHMRQLVHRFGAGQIVIGSDHPFLSTDPAPQAIVDDAWSRGIITAEERTAIRSGNVSRFVTLQTAGPTDESPRVVNPP